MTKIVNSQITDAITQNHANVIASAPAQSMGLVYQAMAHSISLAMQNGVAVQNAMQRINIAVVSTNCKKIVEHATI